MELFKAYLKEYVKGAMGMTGILITIWFVKDCWKRM